MQVAMQDAMLHYIRAGASPPRRATAGRCKRDGDQDRSRAAIRPCGIYPVQGRRARTTTSTSTPAAPIPSTGSGCSSVIGREDLIGDPRFATPRGAHRARGRGRRADRRPGPRKHDKHEAMRLLGDAGIPAGRRARHQGADRGRRPSTSAASCRRWSTRRSRTTRCRPGRCATTARRPTVKPSPLLGRAHRRGARELARPRQGEIEGWCRRRWFAVR